MSNKERRRQNSFHVRFNSSPYIGNLSITDLAPIKSGQGLDDADDDDGSTIRPLDESMQSPPMSPPTHSANRIQVPHPRRRHQKSASYTMDNLAQLARRNSNSNRPNYGSDDGFDDDDHKHAPQSTLLINKFSSDGFNNFHMNKYTKKEQEELMLIQINLKKWIGDEEYLILSQFLELMDKIAPHVSTEEATSMFNKMDAFDYGQIKTNILLHDEFLPRMILNLFKKDDDTASVATTRTNKSLPNDLDLDGVSDDTDYDNVEEVETSHEAIKKIKKLKSENKKLKKWIMDSGQPALEKVDELQRMIDVYESERFNSVSELRSVQRRLSHLGEVENQLKQTRSRSHLLLQEKASLMMTVEESTKERENEQQTLFTLKRERNEYKKLSEELRDLNDKYQQKNYTLHQEQNVVQEEVQSLRQKVLYYETQLTETNEEIDLITKEMMELQTEIEKSRSQQQQQHQHQQVSSDGNGSDKVNDYKLQRKRRMTNWDENLGKNVNNDATSLEQQINTNDANNESKERRNTIRMWYNTHIRRDSNRGLSMGSYYDTAKLQSHHSDETLKSMGDTVLERQDSQKSIQSTTSTTVTHATNPALLLRYKQSYEDGQGRNLYSSHISALSPTLVNRKQDSAQSIKEYNITPAQGPVSNLLHFAHHSSVGTVQTQHDDIFEDAIAQELRNELRKEITAELDEDYQLKLQQKDIEHQLKLHKEKSVIEVHQRRLIEDYEKRLEELSNKLIHAKGLADDDFVYFDDRLRNGDGGSTSSAMTDEDDDKDLDDNDYDHDDNEDEQQPLLQNNNKDIQHIENVLRNKKNSNKKKEKFNKNKNNPNDNLNNINNDDSCFTCFGLFSGSGV